MQEDRTGMRVLLVQTYLGRGEPPVFPLGISYLASNLKDHDVHVIDQNIEDDPWGSLPAKINAVKPDIIGFSLRNIDTTQFRDPWLYFPALQKDVELARAAAPNTPMVVGGPGFSMWPYQVLDRLPEVSYGVHLEGEEIFPQLLDNLSNPASVKGVYYRENGKVMFTGAAPQPAFKDVIPRRDIFAMDRYARLPDSIGVQTKRGCALHCLYCNYPYLNGSKERQRSPQSVVAEMRELKERYGIQAFTFVDSIFNSEQDHAAAICEEIVRDGLKIQWSGYFTEKAMTEEFARLAIRAGCYGFWFSPDALCDKALKGMGKGLTTADVYRVREIVRRTPDMIASYNFFMNPQKQTLGGFLRTVSFTFETKMMLKNRVHGILLGAQRIEPQTPLHRLAINQGYLTKEDDLWADTPKELMHYFYGNPDTRYLDYALPIYKGLWQAKSVLIPQKRSTARL
jgi:anaerobic magnesium-protoporphyrin IX monomethyl ester cyclase